MTVRVVTDLLCVCVCVLGFEYTEQLKEFSMLHELSVEVPCLFYCNILIRSSSPTHATGLKSGGFSPVLQPDILTVTAVIFHIQVPLFC